MAQRDFLFVSLDGLDLEGWADALSALAMSRMEMSARTLYKKVKCMLPPFSKSMFVFHVFHIQLNNAFLRKIQQNDFNPYGFGNF